MKASDFDKAFDEGASVMPFANMDKAQRPNRSKRVNVDFPQWMVDSLDREAQHLGSESAGAGQGLDSQLSGTGGAQPSLISKRRVAFPQDNMLNLLKPWSH